LLVDLWETYIAQNMMDNPVAFNLAGGQRGELPEISLFDEIDDLAMSYERERGFAPIRVSHWDPSAEMLERVGPIEFALPHADPRPYRYSYLIKRRLGLEGVLRKIGFSSSEMRGHLVENSTNAITLIANWLKARGVRSVTLLTPSYFTPRHNLRQLGFELREVHLKCTNGNYYLPDELPTGPENAIWLTNPVYSTGVYPSASEIERLKLAADAGTIIVADEALSVLSKTLARDFDGHPQFVGIYSPHKAVCVNGFKFSIVAFHESAGDSFDHWADVVCGGLSVAAEAAVTHFQLPEFDEYSGRFAKTIENVRSWHDTVVAKFGNSLSFDPSSSGHFLAVYFRNQGADLGLELSFHRELLNQTGCSIIPGQMHEFDPALGLSFRVNLARYSKPFEQGVERLYQYLAHRTLN
jgi:aspartate/methionine/tyrosine aminotransferase